MKKTKKGFNNNNNNNNNNNAWFVFIEGGGVVEKKKRNWKWKWNIVLIKNWEKEEEKEEEDEKTKRIKHEPNLAEAAHFSWYSTVIDDWLIDFSSLKFIILNPPVPTMLALFTLTCLHASYTIQASHPRSPLSPLSLSLCLSPSRSSNGKKYKPRSSMYTCSYVARRLNA